MQTRSLGNTGLKLSIVSYGAASIGNEYGNLDEAQGIRSLRIALDGGVNFIDTSPYYGRGMSEVLLGIATSTVKYRLRGALAVRQTVPGKVRHVGDAHPPRPQADRPVGRRYQAQVL